MAGPQDSFDLLGLGAQEPPPAEVPRSDDVWPLIPAAPSADPPRPEQAEQAPAAGDSEGAGASQQRFIVRCEGRWRVRAAPSLSSKVVGTVANGTVVIAKEDPMEAAASSAGGGGRAGGHVIGSLWVQVGRFEAQEPSGVSEIKRDVASGGELYCLRRNALGYGLYELGLEPLDGPLIMLPDHLSAELRSDALRSAADKSEDVSLTWKLLGAAESVGRFFTSMSGADEGGVNEDMKPQLRRRPEEVFEVRQREQLKKTAGILKKATQKLIAKTSASQGNVLAGMPKEIGWKFARLRSSLADTAQSAPLVAPPQSHLMTASAASTSPTSAVEGSVSDLERFAELLGRVERTGGWPELGGDLRQEIINFSNKHTSDLEAYARSLGKASGPDGVDANSPTQKPKTAPTGGGLLPLLPPPPPPASGIRTGHLI